MDVVTVCFYKQDVNLSKHGLYYCIQYIQSFPRQTLGILTQDLNNKDWSIDFT